MNAGCDGLLNPLYREAAHGEKRGYQACHAIAPHLLTIIAIICPSQAVGNILLVAENEKFWLPDP
jgi:hypothetical protein